MLLPLFFLENVLEKLVYYMDLKGEMVCAQCVCAPPNLFFFNRRTFVLHSHFRGSDFSGHLFSFFFLNVTSASPISLSAVVHLLNLCLTHTDVQMCECHICGMT